jgi:hypothetical protein
LPNDLPGFLQPVKHHLSMSGRFHNHWLVGLAADTPAEPVNVW